MSIILKDISKRFGTYTALDSVSVEVGSGELLALLGPSGCGKTTLLRIIAGLESPDEGAIFLNGADTTHQSVKDKQVGFVFQHYALFPHMTVFENVAFGLRVLKGPQKLQSSEITDRVMELLGMVQMDWSAKRLPSQLSGGQRQRVALARALAVKPRVLLLDEPFSALDAKVRLELRRWLRKLHDELHITSVFVTHDQEEALELADRVVIINKGKVEQQGSPEDVYDNPANPFIFNFLGNVNVFRGRSKEQTFLLDGPAHGTDLGDHDVSYYVRPHDIEVFTNQPGSDALEATIQGLRLRGGTAGLELLRSDGEGLVEVELPREVQRNLKLAKGMQVWIRFKQAKFFDQEDYVI